MATSVIVLVLGLQFVAVVARSDRWGWPFTDYPMYSQSRQEGERLSAHHFIYAKTKDGREVEISADNIGLNIWLFERWGRQLVADQMPPAPAAALAAPESFRAWLKSTRLWQLLKHKDPDLHSIFLAMAEEKLGIEIAQLRVEGTPYVVTRRGIEAAPPTVVVVDVASE